VNARPVEAAAEQVLDRAQDFVSRKTAGRAFAGIGSAVGLEWQTERVSANGRGFSEEPVHHLDLRAPGAASPRREGFRRRLPRRYPGHDRCLRVFERQCRSILELREDRASASATSRLFPLREEARP
jgi:hypothetical protein